LVNTKKQKKLNSIELGYRNNNEGDMYSYIGVRRKTKFFIGFRVGKWNSWTCSSFYKLLSNRLKTPTQDQRITFYSDGNDQDIESISKNFEKEVVDYGMIKKEKKSGKVIGIKKRTIFGNLKHEEIRINDIDGLCSKLRERISCFGRETRSFAKKIETIRQRLEIFSISNNFVEKKKGKVTPAILEGLTNEIWNWEEIFDFRIGIKIKST
jgi:hypothetical protein